ncbi:MAG: hypothetical protein WCI55_12880 [Armatimonadota bacterium]
MVSVVLAMLMGADSAPIKPEKVYSSNEFPIERISGLTLTGTKWVVGGIRGLYSGTPGSRWVHVSDQAIRQVAQVHGMTWALYGNGAVDKLDVAKDQLYSDIFHGAVKRPWVGSMSVNKSQLLFGGSGGWFEKVGDKLLTERYPTELEKRNVTAMAVVGKEKLVGTQDGLFLFGSGKQKRFGFGDGLADVWVTSMASLGDSVFIGTYTGGCYAYSNGSMKKLVGPSSKIRCLSVWRGRLVLGGLDGSWIAESTTWRQLTRGETTFITALNGKLFVGTPESVSQFN